jgi:hypothetical protein
MAELTPQGYVRKTQNEYFEEERALYQAIDALWNLDPSTPDGLKIAHDAEIFSVLDEVLQQAYNSKDPNKAKDSDLDVIGALTGAKRSLGTPSTVDMSLSGTPGTVVLGGTLFESATTGSQWATTQTVTLDGSGVATVDASCTVNGATQADAGTITRIVTVVAGLQTVNNAAPATPGTDRQTNSSFRVTRATAVGRPGNNQIDSMLGELFAVDGVRRAKVYENDTGSDAFDPVDNPHALPKNSISPIIDGGSNDAVALAVYLKKNPGCRLNQAGTAEAVTVVSPVYPQNTKLVRFSRPNYVDMILDITIADDGNLPPNADQLIKEAVLEYANGDLVPADVGFKITGFDIGEDVPYTSIFTPINHVLGEYGNSYVSAMTVNGGTSNVAIAFNELSRWTESNITVTVV